jgi:simple sugar transport system ATP-binding protein
VGAEFLVQLKGITKRFPGVVANHQVDLTLMPGEIHALLGENGSGKSTLMSVLTGLYRPDEGEVFIGGQRVQFRSPHDAIKAGVGMVHQHFKLVDTFTVAQNVILGDRRVPFVPSMSEIEDQIERISSGYGLAVNPRAYVWQLSVGEKQRVEIVKMLYRGCSVLILDEPTAVLTIQESRQLFANIREMAAQGRTVVVITHKLHEVMEIADRVTVLRRGEAVATFKRGGFTERDLALAMVGRDVVSQVEKPPAVQKDVVLELQDVYALNNLGRLGLRSISLTVRGGEILGIAGVAGNGQRELSEVVTGLRPALRGRIQVDGTDVTGEGPRGFIDRGVAHVPEDRLGAGLVPGLNAVDNLILKEYRRKMARGPFLDRRGAESNALELIGRFGVRLSSLYNPVKFMSGGNLQRLLLAREISSEPRLIVAVYPVRGLDIAATEAVHRLLLEQRAQGTAILLISEDLDEIFKLSDRIAVLFEGAVTGVLPATGADAEEIGLLMMGSRKMEEQAV